MTHFFHGNSQKCRPVTYQFIKLPNKPFLIVNLKLKNLWIMENALNEHLYRTQCVSNILSPSVVQFFRFKYSTIFISYLMIKIQVFVSIRVTLNSSYKKWVKKMKENFLAVRIFLIRNTNVIKAIQQQSKLFTSIVFPYNLTGYIYFTTVWCVNVIHVIVYSLHKKHFCRANEIAFNDSRL